MNIRAMIETDTLLEKCPRCGAWPMAAKLPKASTPRSEIRLRCSQCGYQEGGRLLRPEGARPFFQRRQQAGR